MPSQPARDCGFDAKHSPETKGNVTDCVTMNVAPPDTMDSKSESGNTETDDVITDSDDVSTGTEHSIYAPDGGWGWFVTLASFMVAFIVDGIVTSFGLLLPELMTAYGASMSLTSFPASLIVGMFLLSGPATAYLVRRWGCRPVAFCGGLVAAGGIAASAYAPTIELFILSFGVVAGVGIGLIYLPSITIVNIYFHKKRGIVTGIITSGSGFGLLAMAPLSEMLMEEYGWRGCYLIMSAITLNFCVCASLMRPLEIPPAVSRRRQQLAVNAAAEGDMDFPAYADGMSLVSVEELEKDCERPKHAHTLATSSSILSSVKNLFLGDSHLHVSGNAGVLPGAPRVVVIRRSRSHSHLHSSSGPPRSHHTSRSSGHGPDVLATWLACQLPPSLSQHVLHSSRHDHRSMEKMAASPDPVVFQSTGEIPWSRLRECSRHPRHYHSDTRVDRPTPSLLFDNPAANNYRDKADPPLLSVQVESEKAATDHPAVAGYSLKPPANPTSSSTGSDCSGSDAEEAERKRSVAEWMWEYRIFALFLVGAFLIQLVCNIPPLLAPSYAYLHGVSKDQTATILSIFGLMNTLGRLMAGLLVYRGFRSLHVYNVGTLLAGLACFVFPLCTDFPSISVCLALYAFFLGAFPPLQSVLLVEYLGLERLASTFGIMCLVKAFASSAGAPLAGVLYAVTGAYTVPVAACGVSLVIATIFHQAMACCS